MNAYCRRAVSQGVTLARATGGSCTVVTLGPPSAEDVLREAVAWGADSGVHVCDPAFAGSDTLATARALAAALRAAGPFDLVLLGRNSIDGETGQVGPEVAELLDLPFASGVRRLEDRGRDPAPRARARRRHPGGRDRAARRAVRRRAPVRPLQGRPGGQGRRPGGAPDPARRGRARPRALGRGGQPDGRRRDAADGPRALRSSCWRVPWRSRSAPRCASCAAAARWTPGPAPAAAVPPTPGRPGRPTGPRPRSSPSWSSPAGPRWRASCSAPRPASATRPVRPCTRCCPGDGRDLARPLAGADLVVVLEGSRVAEDVADAVAAYVREACPWAVLAPSTAFGREVAGRAAAATGSGLVGDAIALSAHGGALVAAKPAFAGALVADITCRSATQMVTVRPGVLPAPERRSATSRPVSTDAARSARGAASGCSPSAATTTSRRWPGPRWSSGWGPGSTPEEYEQLSPLAAAPGGRARRDPQGHRPGLGTAGPPGRHHRPLHRAPPVRRARAEREVQPHGGRARRGDDPGRQHGPRRPGLRALRHRHRRRLARGRAAPPARRCGTAPAERDATAVG